MKPYLFLFIFFFIVPLSIHAELPLGKKPPVVTLSGDLGGRVNGEPWSSEEISGKVFTLMYVDPDEKEINEHVATALKKNKFPLDKYGSIAIINMDATWLPDFAIASSLEEKQKKYPNTVYVKDLEKELVKKWGLTDDNYDVLVFNQKGEVIFSKDGKLSEEELEKLIQEIRNNL